MPLLRTATEDDIVAVTRIYTHYVRTSTATFEIESPDLSEMNRRRVEILAKGLPYLVAEESGSVVGYAYASLYRPRPAYRFTVEDSIYIHPEFRSHGLGRLLLAALIDACRKQGSRQMIAIIGGSGNTASIRLHAAFGFHQVGILQKVGYKFDQWVDTVIMQRAIDGDDLIAERKCVGTGL